MRSTRRNRVLLVIGLGFGLFVLLAAIALRNGKQTAVAAQSTADQFLAYIQHGRYAQAHALLSSDAQSQEPTSSLPGIEAILERQHGRQTAKPEAIGWNTHWMNGVTSVDLTYRAKYARGERMIFVRMIQIGEQWRVQAFNFQI